MFSTAPLFGEKASPGYNKKIDTDTKCNKKVVIGAVALFALLATVAVISAYFLSPVFPNFLNHTFTHIQNGHMSVGQGLLHIGLPILGASFLVGLAVHLYRKHQQQIQKRDDESDEVVPFKKDFVETLKSLKPTRKQAIAIGITVGALAIIAVAGYLVLTYVHPASQWLHSALQHKVHIWKAMAYIGGGAVGVSLLTGLAIYALQKHSDARQSTTYHESLDEEFVNTDQ